MHDYINYLSNTRFVYTKTKRSLKYHIADRNNRAYLCGCLPNQIRLGKKIKHCGTFIKKSNHKNTMFSSKLNNLWGFLYKHW